MLFYRGVDRSKFLVVVSWLNLSFRSYFLKFIISWDRKLSFENTWLGLGMAILINGGLGVYPHTG